MFRTILNNYDDLRYPYFWLQWKHFHCLSTKHNTDLNFQYVFILFIQAVIIPSYLTIKKKSGIHLELTKCFWQVREYIMWTFTYIMLSLQSRMNYTYLWSTTILSVSYLIVLVTFCLGYFLVDIHKWAWSVAFF